MKRIGIAPGILALAMGFEPGCAARVYSAPGQPYPAAVDGEALVYVDAVPANIEVYPHYYYGDGYAYFVDGRWYHRGPRGWGYYRREPPELQQQRVHVAPAARERPYVQAPMAPRERPSSEEREPAGRGLSPGVVEQQPRREDVPQRTPRSERRDDREHERGR